MHRNGGGYPNTHRRFHFSPNKKMKIIIRPAVRGDAETIARFNSAMAEETEHIRLDADRLLRGVLGLFDAPSLGRYGVAEVDGIIAGQMMITYEWSDWRNGVFWWIQSVYVLPEYRARGIYRALYEKTVDDAKKAGNVCGLRLYVEKENRTAHSVYEKLGMALTAYDMYEVDFIIKR
jgi:GNAT superfamily N-acetyltransferase